MSIFGRDRVYVVPAGRSRTEYVTREVHEHRAPTDQSVALLREMEEAAKSRVIASVPVADCVIPCELHWLTDVWRDDSIIRAIFSINGKKMAENVDVGQKDPQDAIDALIAAVADRVARECLAPALRSIASQLFRNRP
jgi:uncharacterized protein YegJ (DUF2314 family)